MQASDGENRHEGRFEVTSSLVTKTHGEHDAPGASFRQQSDGPPGSRSLQGGDRSVRYPKPFSRAHRRVSTAPQKVTIVAASARSPDT